ncbi:MAG: HepT-like ribonuclease domain-containing protein, partial [Geitlerinemataceae cyanobacterium]
MTQRGLRESLEDILDAISEINSFLRGVTFEDFLSNREKVLAVVKLLEIIGEATKKIPSELRNKYPDIPWSSVAGMRDIL